MSLERNFVPADQQQFRAPTEKALTLPMGVSLVRILTVGSGITDATGVPVLSDRADPALNRGRDYQYQGCPFADSPSRYPDGQSHPKPMSGLERERFLENYPSMLSIMTTVRDAYVASSENPDTERQLNIDELKDVLSAVKHLPQYLVLRGKDSVRAQGVMHPALIVLSNAASGAIGSLEGYLEAFGNPERPLNGGDVVAMIKDSEERGVMIGNRTVCVAEPKEMRHFIASTIYGPKTNNADTPVNPEIASLFDAGEVRQMVVFGENAYEAGLLYDGFKQVDVTGEILLKPYVGQNIDSREPVGKFLLGCARYLEEFDDYQVKINTALGRRTLPPLTVYDFEEMGFRTPGILRKLKIGPSAVRRLAASAERSNGNDVVVFRMPNLR